MRKINLVDPKNDVAFRKVFGDESHQKAICSFLNAVMELKEEEKVLSAELLDRSQLPDIEGAKDTIVDVRVKDQRGHQYIVEMQVDNQASFGCRSVYYLSKAYTRQLQRSEDYAKLKPVRFIGILDFNLFNEDDTHYINPHLIINQKNGKNELNQLAFYYLELKKFKKELHECGNTLDLWCYLFKQGWKLQELPIEFGQDEGITEAIETLEEHTWTEAELVAYEKNRDFKTNQEHNLQLKYEKGLQEGELKAKQLTAQKMLAKGLPIDDIAELTGLSREQIEQLQAVNAQKP